MTTRLRHRPRKRVARPMVQTIVNKYADKSAGSCMKPTARTRARRRSLRDR